LFRSLAAPRALHSFPTRRSSDLLLLLLGRLPGVDAEQGDIALLHEVRRFPEGVDRFALDVVVRGEDDRAGTVRVGFVEHQRARGDRKSTRLNSSHVSISYAVFCL